MGVTSPIPVSLPSYGVLFAESIHEPEFRMPERSDPFDKLLYVLRGSVRYQAEMQPKRKAAAGTILVVPKGTRHQMKDERASVILILCFSERFIGTDPELREFWRSLAGSSLVLAAPGRHELEHLWRRALAERHRPQTGGSAVIRALAVQVLALLARLPAQMPRRTAPGRVAAILADLEASFYEPWSIDSAASRAGLSRRRFTELFRRAAGASFGDYLAGRRLEHARTLLCAGEHSVLGAIFSCGFSDVSHFYRLYRKRFGIPPGKTRSLP